MQTIWWRPENGRSDCASVMGYHKIMWKVIKDVTMKCQEETVVQDVHSSSLPMWNWLYRAREYSFCWLANHTLCMWFLNFKSGSCLLWTGAQLGFIFVAQRATRLTNSLLPSIAAKRFYFGIAVVQRCPILLLEGHIHAEFSHILLQHTFLGDSSEFEDLD